MRNFVICIEPYLERSLSRIPVLSPLSKYLRIFSCKEGNAEY